MADLIEFLPIMRGRSDSDPSGEESIRRRRGRRDLPAAVQPKRLIATGLQDDERYVFVMARSRTTGLLDKKVFIARAWLSRLKNLPRKDELHDLGVIAPMVLKSEIAKPELVGKPRGESTRGKLVILLQKRELRGKPRLCECYVSRPVCFHDITGRRQATMQEDLFEVVVDDKSKLCSFSWFKQHEFATRFPGEAEALNRI